jgi:hypothetical protein
MPTIDRKDVICRTLLKETEADSPRFRAQMVPAIIEKYAELKSDPDHFNFLSKVDDDTADCIYPYNYVLDFIECDNLDIESKTEQMYRFHSISAHQGHLRASDRDNNGSTYKFLIERER